MKKSFYNIIVPQKNFVILYNSFTDKFLGVSHTVVDCFNKSIDLELFQKQYPKIFDTLKERGFIVDDNFDELGEIRLRNKIRTFANRKLYIMIYPTQDCNLKCWYCYESHIKDSFMSKDIMERIVKIIQKKAEQNEFDSLLVGFFGGEPLLKFDIIAYPLAVKLKNISNKYAKEFNTFFVTNASLMTPELIIKLKDLNPYFQITLDGNRKKHNTVRIWKKDNAGTYDNIIQSIINISNNFENYISDGDRVITLRINYDNQTLKNVTDIISDLEKADKSKIIVHFERVWQTQKNVNEEQQQLLLDTMKSFLDNGFSITHGVFRRKDISCPAESSDFMIINYDGRLYKCNGRTLSPETKEGILTLNGEIQWDKNMQIKRMSQATFENEKCLKCKILPLCMGPCSQKLIEMGGFKKEICSLNSIDISFEDYLSYVFEMRYLN